MMNSYKKDNKGIVIYDFHPGFSYEQYEEQFNKWYTNKYGENGVAPFESQLLPKSVTIDLDGKEREYSLEPLHCNTLNKQMEDLMYDSFMAGSKTIPDNSWPIIVKALRGESLSKDEKDYADTIADIIESFDKDTEYYSTHIYEYEQ